MKKLFIIPDNGDTAYTLITEDGEPLASHWCSGKLYAKSDLIERRPERQKEYKERFGEYTVMFLSEQTEITEEELFKRNEAWYNALPEDEKEPQPSNTPQP